MTMMHIYWKWDEFNPSIYTGTPRSIWQLWFHLTHGSNSNVSSGIHKIVILNNFGDDITEYASKGIGAFFSRNRNEFSN